ncbi:MAG: hypothetical protein AB7G87_01110 [Clostridia bacterium]
MPKKKYIPTEERIEIKDFYMGKKAWFKAGTLEFAVQIIDVFSKPSRLDFKVIPLWGFGSKWVQYEDLNFDEAELLDESGLERTGIMRRP